MVSYEWYEILVQPFLVNHQVILLSTLGFFILQFASIPLLKYVWIGKKKWQVISAEERTDLTLRIAAIAHALISWGEIPVFFSKGLDIHNDLETYYYHHNPISQFYFSIGAGYFIWDVIVSFYCIDDTAFRIHAVTCLGALYFSLFPYAHHLGIFFHGIFEISTVFAHTRVVMIAAGQTGPLLLLCDILALVTFTVVRICIATYYTFFQLLPDMYTMMKAGNVHSYFVVSYMLTANLTIMILQYYWWIYLVLGGLYEKIFPSSVADKEDYSNTKSKSPNVNVADDKKKSIKIN